MTNEQLKKGQDLMSKVNAICRVLTSNGIPLNQLKEVDEYSIESSTLDVWNSYLSSAIATCEEEVTEILQKKLIDLYKEFSEL